jgi:hypothetical protein
MSDKPVLPDPDAPPSEEELAEAKKLRDSLENPAAAHGDAELARALSAAWSPRDLSPGEHRALLDRALAGHASRRRGGLVVYASFAAGALAALAAGVALVLGGAHGSPSASQTVATQTGTSLVSTRSTQALFREPFASTGGQTARVDRIAMARAADLRKNEFARWGVR